MTYITLDVLQRIAKDKPDNYFLRGLIRLIVNEDWDTLLQQKFIDRIPHPDNSHHKVEVAETIMSSFNLLARPYQDYRFRCMYLNAFRKYPSGLSYGLDFRTTPDDNTCNSLYIVGGNGSGKTSLYSAMEYLCLGNISAAVQRGFSMSNRINEYTSYANSNISPEISISTHDYTTLSLDKELPNDFLEIKDFLPTFFCSEVDIIKLAENGENLDTFVMHAIGMNKLQELSLKMEEERQEILRQISINPDILKKDKEDLLHEKDELEMRINLYNRIQDDNDLLGYWKSNQINLKSFVDVSKKDLLLDINKLKVLNEKSIGDCNSAIKSILLRIKRSLATSFPESSQVIKLFNDAIKHCENLKEDEYLVELDDIELHTNDIQAFTIQDAEAFNRQLLLLLEEYLSLYEQSEAGKIGMFYIGLQEKIKENEIALSEIIDRIRYLDTMPERYSAHYEPLVELIKEINDEISIRKRYVFNKTKSLLEKIINDFLFSYERFEVVRENDTIKAIIYFCNEANQEIPLTPRLYLNSFRYKLYCVSLKIAVAFIIKDLLHFNFPLIFDDVFYSSDFTNRSKVKGFIENIYTIHREIFKDDKRNELQIIFFTHDEILKDAVRSATINVPHTIYARLFDYREIRNSDERREEHVVFYNLYSKL